jgi:hypothetical protein
MGIKKHIFYFLINNDVSCLSLVYKRAWSLNENNSVFCLVNNIDQISKQNDFIVENEALGVILNCRFWQSLLPVFSRINPNICARESVTTHFFAEQTTVKSTCLRCAFLGTEVK